MQRHAPHVQHAWCAYSRHQAAGILHVPVSQIDAAIQRGDLTCFRVGKHVRIADSALRAFAGQDGMRESA